MSAAYTDYKSMAIEFLDSYQRHPSRLQKVFADGFYKGRFGRAIKQQFNAKTEITSRPPNSKGFVPVKIRWVVKRALGG